MTIPYISYVLKHTLDDFYLRIFCSSLFGIPSFFDSSGIDSPESINQDINSFIPSFLPSFLPFCTLIFPYSSNKLIIPSQSKKKQLIKKLIFKDFF